MGLTKQYSRFLTAGHFNIIASSTCNATFVTLDSQEGRYVAVGASEHIIIWDMKLGEKVQILPGEKSKVSVICASPNKRHLAAGYTDGNVLLYDLKSAEVISIFSGHHSEITCLVFDNFGHKLASGSKDTDIIVWDTVAESGLYRLSGHRGIVTQLLFLSSEQILISASKDTYIKFWDLNTRHCFKTLAGHRTEIYSLALMKDDRYLVSGSVDSELRTWKIVFKNDDENKNLLSKGKNVLELDESEEGNSPLDVYKIGAIMRKGKGRVVSMFCDGSNQILGCHGVDNQIELFYFCSDIEAQNRWKKRIKKEKKKSQQNNEENDNDNENVTDDKNLELALKDEVKRLASIEVTNKPKSFDLVLGNEGELRVIVSLVNNSLELYSLQTNDKTATPTCLRSIKNHGHQSEVRVIKFSGDNLVIASGSAEAVKIWNRSTQTCLRTIKTGSVLSLAFVPGDRHLLVGLNTGCLLIVDIAVGDILEEIPAHTTELWSICISPDKRGCVTGGGDKTVKFWQFQLIPEEKNGGKTKILSLLHIKTLKLNDNVLCTKLSANGKFVAVALLDSTVKIFFVDTLKFFLSLYGHKLPVLSMDISSDSTLIITGSADRNIKIWGMDFGDCHKSIFAHDDSITGLEFVHNTHYFFSCGKDGRVKMWDGDIYKKIITLQGHLGEAWCLSVSSNGNFMVSSGSDRVLRLFEKSEQTVVLQDEEEEERNQEELMTGEQTLIRNQQNMILPTRKTVGSENAAEKILECLEISKTYKEQLDEHNNLQAASRQNLPMPQLPLLMQVHNVTTVEDFLLEVLQRIRSSDLEEALILIPFTAVCDLISMMPSLIQKNNSLELICKVLVFLLQLHYAPIVMKHDVLLSLKQLHKLIMSQVGELRDLVGYNLYSLQFIQMQTEAMSGIQLFKDIAKNKDNVKKHKPRHRIKRSIIHVSN